MAINIVANIKAYSKLNLTFPLPTVSDANSVLYVDKDLKYSYMPIMSASEVDDMFNNIMNNSEDGEQ